MTALLPLLLLAPASSHATPTDGHTTISGERPAFFVRLWESLGLWPRIALFGLVALGLVVLVVWALKQLNRGRWRNLMAGITTVCLAAFTVFGFWAARLPTPRGTYFVLWHQIVRVAAVVTGMGFILGAMALLIPRVFDRFEGQSFVPFIAARHVRSQKSAP